MSQINPLIVPPKPSKLTLDTLPELFAHHRARFGGWTMTSTPPEPEPPADPPPTPPERPDGVSEAEWTALGDPGRSAIVRERDARQAAERALAVARAKPAPPKPTKVEDPPKPPADPPAPKPGEIDVEAIVTRAVEAAVKPFQEAEQRRDTEAAADRVRQAVLDAAKPRLHDATDALAGIDLAGVVDDQGGADPEKVKTALDDLVTRKPHLAKVATTRTAPPGIGGGAPAGATEAERVKAVLSDMQRATGVRSAAPSTTS